MDSVGLIDALSGPSHAGLGSYWATMPAIIMPVMLNLCLTVQNTYDCRGSGGGEGRVWGSGWM